MLLCYEITRDLPLADVDIETPLANMKSSRIAGKKFVFAPVLRAGMTFAEGMLDLVPTARVAHIGLYREPETFVAVEYFFKAPSDLHERLVIVISPVMATANSAVAAVDRLKERGVNDIDGMPYRRAGRCRAHAWHSPGRSDLARSDRQRAGRTTPTFCQVSATPVTVPTAPSRLAIENTVSMVKINGTVSVLGIGFNFRDWNIAVMVGQREIVHAQKRHLS